MTQQPNDQNVLRRKLVIIGDGACGKTSLLSVFTLGYFPTVRLVILLDEPEGFVEADS